MPPTLDLRGVLVPLTTPFSPDGSPALDRLASNIARYDRLPLTGYVVTGSTGESVMLTRTETERIWAAAREAVGDHHRIYRACRGARDALDRQPAVFEQIIEYAPGEGAVGAAALQGEIDAFFHNRRRCGRFDIRHRGVQASRVWSAPAIGAAVAFLASCMTCPDDPVEEGAEPCMPQCCIATFIMGGVVKS